MFLEDTRVGLRFSTIFFFLYLLLKTSSKNGHKMCLMLLALTPYLSQKSCLYPTPTLLAFLSLSSQGA